MSELKTLLAQQEALAKQIEETRNTELLTLKRKILKAVDESPFSFKEVMDAKEPLEPKYQDPASKETWTGRGAQPKWMKDAIKKGKKKESFLIKSNPIKS